MTYDGDITDLLRAEQEAFSVWLESRVGTTHHSEESAAEQRERHCLAWIEFRMTSDKVEEATGWRAAWRMFADHEMVDGRPALWQRVIRE